MKKITIILVMLLGVTPANADVYVKVNANGNAIGGAIMCDAGTCDAGSEYSRLTLQAGERYVLQGTGQAGIGNNNPNTQVQVDLQTNEWTITRQVEVKPTVPVIINDQPVISYTTQTVEKFTPTTNPSNPQPTPVAPVIVPPVVDSGTTTAIDSNTATSVATSVDTPTVMVQQSTNLETQPTAVTALSNVIWAIKNQILLIQKLYAKILIRTKGIK
jgi:hypothetical protein